MILLRAINPAEFNEFLRLNSINLINELSLKKKYLFSVHKDTIWVDSRIGLKRYNVYDIAKAIKKLTQV